MRLAANYDPGSLETAARRYLQITFRELDESRLPEILDRAVGRTEEQVRELVAALRPQPAPMDLLRRLPGPRPSSATSTVSAGPALPTSAPPPPRPRIEPILDELHVLRITVGRELVADLEAAKAALSPDGRLEKVLHECLRRALRQLGNRQVVPFARGGPATVDSLKLVCARHNRHLAAQELGGDHVARAVAASARAAPRRRLDRGTGDRSTQRPSRSAEPTVRDRGTCLARGRRRRAG